MVVKNSRWYGRVPITVTLAIAIGVLVFLTAGLVFGVGVWLARKNTFDLLSTNANQAVSADMNQIKQHLQPAEYQSRFIADLISQGDIDPSDHITFNALLTGSLAAAPQIDTVVYINGDFETFGMSQNLSTNQIDLSSSQTLDDATIRESMKSSSQGPFWLPPMWHEIKQKAYMSRVHPVTDHGEVIGAVVAEVAVQELSDFISMKEHDLAGNHFILYGRKHVLAHWLMVDGYPERSTELPLPRLDRFADPILASMWQWEVRSRAELDLTESSNDHVVDIAGQDHVFVFKNLEGYGMEPLIVGAYFQGNDLPKEIERMIDAMIAGFAALALSLLAAVVLGRLIARPIIRFSSATGRIRHLEISKVEALPGSMFRELNDQSVAFNSMLKALRWFEFYVPKEIVEQLVRQGEIRDSQTEAREITVMFTDVVGFSTVSEGMLAEEVAAFVNHHFSIVVKCIEDEEGTVDKFMGDAVMAFWQDSAVQGDHAERACRAAMAVSEAIQQDNIDRKKQGDPPVGIRMGIHTGVATVGNIGAPGRLNYTIIGDTVNVGQRLEQLGKEVYPLDAEVSILISSDTAAKLPRAFAPIAAGSYRLKGRVAEIDVYKLERSRET